MEVNVKSDATFIELQIKYPNIPNLSFNFIMKLTVYKQVFPSMTYHKQFQNSIIFPKTKILVQNLQSGKMYKVQLKCKSGGLKQEITKNIFTFTKHAQEQEQNLSQNQSNSSEESLARIVKDNMKRYFQMYGERQQNQRFSQRNNLQQQQAKTISNNSSNRNFNQSQNFEHNQRNQLQYKKGCNNQKSSSSSFSNSELMMKNIGQCSSFIKKNKVQKYLLEGRKCKNLNEFVNQKGKKHNPQKERRQILQKKILVAKGMDVFNQIYNNEEGMKFFKNDWFMGPFYSYDQNQKNIKKQK